jgi:hypothetical protein
MEPIEGTFWILLLYDVAESIDLDAARRLLGAEPASREPAFKNPAPDYVRFERPPVLQPLEVAGFTGRLKYFDYGVVCVELTTEFRADWDQLISLTARWINTPELEPQVRAAVDREVRRLAGAFTAIYPEWLSEEYYIVRLSPGGLTAKDLLASFGQQVAQVVRGESVTLSEEERDETLRSSISYYRDDLLVAGWLAALVFDTAPAAETAIQLLEYANTQLLELRHYDQLLTRVLAEVYQSLERKGGLLRRWRLARQAERLNRIRLDIIELTERSDNSIKFLSDMFYARAYRLAAEKIGVSDYRRPVEAKLHTAGELYDFMVNQFHQARAFVLEFMIVAILVIDLFYLFRGRG